MDLDVKAKATMLGACFLIVSVYNTVNSLSNIHLVPCDWSILVQQTFSLREDFGFTLIEAFYL